eukprot:XP_544568.4 LOW QUALITY PROTEIN: mitotic spindle assembly checkpoint protein MAD2B [Canis lupus familiaris]
MYDLYEVFKIDKPVETPTLALDPKLQTARVPGGCTGKWRPRPTPRTASGSLLAPSGRRSLACKVGTSLAVAPRDCAEDVLGIRRPPSPGLAHAWRPRKGVQDDVFDEFLEGHAHLIMRRREVYPVGIFQKSKKYNVPVQMSCHPELNQYIQDTLHCVKPLLEKNDVEKVVVVILDKEHRPVEKFVFEITQPPLLSISSDSLLSHVEQLLRAFILKISVCDAVLDHNPPGCTFTVLVHTREAATRNMEKIQVIKDFPWILADEQDVHMHDPRLIPLKTMTSDILKMQLYVEERAHKSS